MKATAIVAASILILSCTPQKERTNQYADLTSLLEKMHDSDQVIRQELYANGSMDSKILGRMMEIDEANQHTLDSIMEIHGWLPQRLIGEKAADAIFLITQHGSNSVLEERLPIIKLRAENGEAKKQHAAMMEDRVLMHKGQKQIYGTQSYGQKLDNGETERFIWPIENPNGVNERRKRMGFETTVEENALRLESRYDPKEKLPKEKDE